MIEVLLSYWQPFLYSDGQQISGLAMTLWLTTASIGMGFVLSIPLAIARPQLSVSLVDTVQKKATFLQQAAIELGLRNLRVHHARVEQMTGQYAQISSRAFADLKTFVELTRHLLAPDGRWLAMKGAYPAEESPARSSGTARWGRKES